MAVSHGLRQHSKLGGRFRKRRDSEEENIYLDLNRATPEVIQEILFNVVNQDVNISRKLGYLNGLVKMCIKQQREFGVSYRDIFCCLRVAFFHETCEVRAAGLRACRYLMENVETLEVFLQVKLQFLVSRSLDISLDNRIERVQALRLMRKVLELNPSGFPRAFSSCLVAIVNEGSQERDMIRPCLATLAQLALLNPHACIEAKGVNALMRNLVENVQVQASEAVLGVIFFLINDPSTRDLMKDDFGLENLLAPFTDLHYRFPSSVDGSSSEDKDPNLNSSKAAIVCALLSWPGLIYLCKSDSCHLQSLVEMLYLPYADLRKNILDLLYQIFDILVPEWTEDFSVALNSSDPSALKASWQLYKGYVVAEGLDVLSYSSKDRTNLTHNYYALLVLVFVNSGLLEALSEVIVTSEIHLAVRATIFLGEFIYLANQFLPVDCSHLSNCLPILISSAASFKSSREQNQSTAAITCLFRIHELKKRGPVPNSLVLSNILHVCNPDRERKGFFVGTVNKIKLWKYLKQEMTDGIDQAMKDTQVLNKDYQSWDWDLIDCILKNPSDSLKRLDDANHRVFIKKLLQFFKPSSSEFSEMEFDKDNGRQICVTGCHLLEFCLELEEIKAQEYLDDFLNDLNTCFVQLTKDGDRLNSILSPIKVSSTFSQMYFLFIGKLSSTHKGCKFLNRCSTFQNLLHLVGITNQDIYIKLIVSALDYTKEGFSRAILTKVLTGTEEATRLYATNFLLVLLRAKLPDYRKWAIEVLVYQLHDVSKLVSAAALDILDEACTIPENLEALISLRPSLLQLGDKGLLLLVRYLSVHSGFSFLRESNFLYCELERWQQIYNFKYVKVVEDLLNEGFTRHRRSDDGTYGRRSSDLSSHSIRDVYLPPHMYGQLVQHAEGLKVLENEDVLSELYNNIRYPKFSSAMDILHLKASLWAVGHIGSYPLGLRIVLRENLIHNIVDLVASAPFLAIRGTCYFVLGLLSSTPEGVEAVREYGWEAVQRNHEDKWPLIREEVLINSTQCVRKSTWSFSSMSSEWPLGALPTSLSFIVRTSQLDLTRTQSESSCNSNEDILQNSCIELPSHREPLIDSDSTSEDGRRRSSSDCQSDRKENVLFQVVESSSWDALNTYSTFSPPVHFNRYAKRRSISTSDVDAKAFDLDAQSDTEENVEDEPQINSLNSNKTNLNTINTLSIPKRHSSFHASVNPVASDSSVNSSKSSEVCVERPSLLKLLSRGHSVHLQSPVSPDKPSPLLLTSARDALGYATLKDIQRRRVNSLSFHDSSSTEVDISLRYLKSQSLDADAAKVFNITQNDLLFTEAEEDPTKSRNSSQDTESVVPDSRYIGLCLPSNLQYIFCVPKQTVYSEFEPQASKTNSDDTVLEFHTEEKCLSNHSFADKRSLQRITIDEETEEPFTIGIKSSDDGFCRKHLPLDRSNSVKGLLKFKDDSLNSQYLIRKEAMRFVTNLCSSVAVKASEQGLLNLKQKFPSAFQDICLYSEISYYMANYNFRLTARRFLQELFLDVAFEQLQLEAEAVVGILGIPQMGGSEV